MHAVVGFAYFKISLNMAGNLNYTQDTEIMH